MTRGAAKSKNGRAGKTTRGLPALEPSRSIAIPLQQRCINVFRDAFQPGQDDKEVLQEVKGHLYNRNFTDAFSKEEYLRVYASRYSPSRALGYLSILADLEENFVSLLPPTDGGPVVAENTSGFEPYRRKAVFLGGASAELVALAGWLRSTQSSNSGGSSDARIYWQPSEAVFVDIADWNSIVEILYQGVTTAPELSKYASAAAKAANSAIIDQNQLKANFFRQDLLKAEPDTLRNILSGTGLVTLLFTLNELYNTSLSRTQDLLSQLTCFLQPGALLLVVDSPGSYSTVSINGAEKRYPMHWLLDHTLLGPEAGRSGEHIKWTKLLTDDSRWFRLPAELQYPIELENMRYQIHLYRRSDAVSTG